MNVLKKFIEKIRFLISKEIKSQQKTLSKNLENKLQDIALHQSALYVLEHMASAIPVSSPFQLYDYIFENHELLEGNLFCEFGVFKGNSINYMAKKVKKKIHGFDSFEGLPEQWTSEHKEGAFDLKGEIPKVEQNVVLHKGWFEDTLPGFLEEYKQPLALLHIDCDLYSSTKTIFEFIEDRIVKGTVIIFDEYFNYPFWQNNEYKAFEEMIEKTKLNYEYLCYNKFHEQVAVKIL